MREKKELSPWMVSLARAVLQRRGIVLILLGGISVLAAWQIQTRLRVDNSVELFAPAESAVTRSLEKYRDIFGRDDAYLISARADDAMGVFRGDFLERLQELQRTALQLELKVESLGERKRDRDQRRGLEIKAANPPQGDQGEGETDKLDVVDTSTEWGEDESWGDEEGWGDEVGGSVFIESLSLINARRSVGGDDGIQMLKWFDPIPAGDARLQRGQLALADPLIRERLVSTSGDFTVLILRCDFMSEADSGRVADALLRLIEAHQAPGFKLELAGPAVVNHALNEVILADMERLVLLSVFALLGALAFLYRRPLMVAGPIIVVLLSVLWTMGVMAALNLSLNLLSSILPTFLLCVGLGDSIHLQSLYQSARREGHPQLEAIIRACGLTGLPVLFTSLTTMIGLLSFRFATVTAIQEMGLAGGLGVGFALLLSLLLLPITLSWQREEVGDKNSTPRESEALGEPRRHQKDLIDRGLAWLVGLSAARRGRQLVLFLGFALTVTSIYGMGLLDVRHDDLENIPDDVPIKASLRNIDAALGGSAPGELLIEADGPLGVGALPLLQAFDRVKAAAMRYRDPDGIQLVGHVMSVSDIVRETRRALLGGGHEHDRLPETQEETSQLMSLFELQSPEDLKRVSSIDRRFTHLSLQIKWREATSYGPLIAKIRESVETELKGLAKVEPTGGIYLAHQIVSSLLRDLTRSFTAAFLVITLLMILMLRDLKLGLLAMVPNLLPIITILGLLGYIGIPLDLNNLLIASIALGIAVDDTIHFLHHFQAPLSAGASVEEALNASMRHAGRAMLSTSIILSAGFLVYLFASTEALRRFGVLISGVVFLAFFIDLILCPALLRWAYHHPTTSFDGVERLSGNLLPTE